MKTSMFKINSSGLLISVLGSTGFTEKCLLIILYLVRHLNWMHINSPMLYQEIYLVLLVQQYKCLYADANDSRNK